MAERITDQQVADLIALLRTDAPVDVKVQHVTAVKSSIKQHTVPETCILPVFDALRTASSSQNSILVNAGFTALNHLFTRLARQDPKILAKEGVRTLPLVVEKLGDPKEKFRQVAQQALVTLYKVAPTEVERNIRNVAMVGKSAKAKEASLHWLLQMHQEHGLQFRAYVPNLMELLEDADPVVRDVAKSTVIELFKNAPNGAKSDLKKQLKIFKVRPAIEQAIIKELNPTPSSSAHPSQTESFEEPAAPRSGLGASLPALPHRPITPGPAPESGNAPEAVEPLYVNTVRELEDILREMHLYFEGKETEQNWMKREESITRLRRMLAGNAPTDFPDQFIAGLRALLDGIIKAVVSLRTSLSKEGCNLVQDMARVFGPGIDPMVEILMQTFIKLTAATKKISSQLANVTVDTIVERVTYTNRIMQHIWFACQDKNVQPRLYACGWLKTLLNKEAHHKHHVEHTGGVDLIEKCIKKGLSDANPGVREKMRATYWAFAAIWPARAEAIMSGLDATAARLLQNDPNNPKSPKKAEGGGGPVRPGLGLSKSTIGTSKPSVREAMMAQKRAMTAKAMPPRPGSAMANLSPHKTMTSSQTHTTTATTTRSRPESTMLSGGISGAPVRPGRRRPETIARPATAGPYSVRGHDQPGIEQASPPSHAAKPKPVTPKAPSVSPKRPVSKLARPLAYPAAGEQTVPTPPRESTPKGIVSPRATPSRTVVSHLPTMSSPSKSHEDMSLIAPPAASYRASPPQGPTLMASALEREPPHLGSPGTPSRLPRPVGSSPANSSHRLIPVEERMRSPAQSPRQVVEATTPVSLSPPRSLEVYEDPLTREQPQHSPKPIFGPVLEHRPVNEDAALLQQAAQLQPQKESHGGESGHAALPPEKLKQLLRLLDSGVAKIQQKTLDTHGFRKVQSILRDLDGGSHIPVHHTPTTTPAPVLLTDEKFSALATALFDFLEASPDQFPGSVANLPERIHDLKAQALATIRMLLRGRAATERSAFAPHVARGIESFVRARAAFEGRTHLVGALEVLAEQLCGMGDGAEIVAVLVRLLEGVDVDGSFSAEGFAANGEEAAAAAFAAATAQARSLSMGLLVLRRVLNGPSEGSSYSSSSAALQSSLSLPKARQLQQQNGGGGGPYVPNESESAALARLAARCFESPDSAVRMDAVMLCVALHKRVGEARFWELMKGVGEDPKSLITYYIVKEQREREREGMVGGRVR